MSVQSAVIASVQLAPGDIYRLSLLTLFHRFWWFLGIMAVVASWLFWTILTGRAEWEWSLPNVLGPLFVLVFVPYAYFVAPYFAAKKYLKKNPNITGMLTYIYSDAGIDVTGPHSQAHMNWEAVLKVKETSAHFFLYSQTAIAQIIPKRFLSQSSDQAALRALISAHVKDAKLRS